MIQVSVMPLVMYVASVSHCLLILHKHSGPLSVSDYCSSHRDNHVNVCMCVFILFKKKEMHIWFDLELNCSITELKIKFIIFHFSRPRKSSITQYFATV